jgi:antitoxin YobK
LIPMGMRFEPMLEVLSGLFKDHQDLIDIGQPASDSKISKCEDRLNLKFPDEFKEYLAKWGQLSFGPHDYLGIDDGPFDIVLWTEKARDRYKLPNNFLVVCDRDGDESVCLDTDKDSSRRFRIIVWDNINREVSRIRSDSFQSFLINELNEWFTDHLDMLKGQ